jgi:hypothetical protein
MKSNLQEFIGALYHSQKVIEFLFSQKPNTKFKDELFEYDQQLTEERFRRLLNLNIVQEANHKYFLDERVIEFLNDFLQIGEINIGEIGNIIQKVRRSFLLYQESGNILHLQRIKRLLQSLRNDILTLIIRLRNKIDESYKSAQSYELKKIELGFCRQDIKSLEEGIEESKKLLEEYKNLFDTDAEIAQLVVNLKYSFLQSNTYLFDIQNQILEYLHKIYQQDEFYRHIQKLKDLKDKSAGLHFVSNIGKIANENKALFLDKYERPKPYVSLNYLFEEEGVKIIKKIREKRNQVFNYTPKAKLVTDTTREEKAVVEIDKDELFAMFTRNSENLFVYLMNFDFSPQLADFDAVMRINLFVEMVVDYGELMNMTNDYATFEFANHAIIQGLDYQIILPKVL